MGPDSVERKALLEVLERHRSLGEYLLESARMVGDEDDHAVWKQGRLAWSMRVHAALAGRVSERLVGDHDHSAPDGWKQSYEAELRSVTSDLTLIVKVTETIRSENAREVQNAQEDDEEDAAEQRFAVPSAASTPMRVSSRTPALAC